MKKLSNVFSKDNVEYLVTNHFTEILVIIGSFGIFVILFIIMIFAFSSKNHSYNDKEKISTEERAVKQNVENNRVNREILISPEDLIVPTIKSFNVTADFEDFLPGKKFEMPDMKIVVDNYQIILNNSIEESLKFNFERRKKERE